MTKGNKKHSKQDTAEKKLRRESRAKKHPAWEVILKTNPEYAETEGRLGDRFPALTKIEIRICVLVRAGKKSWEIGEILGIEEHTVSNHRTDIRQEIGVKGNFEKFLRPF